MRKLLLRLFGALQHGPANDCDPQSPVDANVERVRAMLHARSVVGYRKYGTTTERTDIDLLGWIRHLQEELLDAAVYCERLKEEIRLSSLDTPPHGR